jgi:hypothetical protein
MSAVTRRLKRGSAGFIAVTAGALVLLMINTDPSGAEAPLWIVNAAASTFVFAGLSIVANAFGYRLVGKLCGLAVAFLLATPGLWMLFDGQGASCSASVAIGGMSAASGAASGLCRAVFGVGGIATIAAALLFTWLAFRGNPRHPTAVFEPEA